MGGNVFEGTTDFVHQSIDALLHLVNNSILEGTNIECLPVGSAATPLQDAYSGDLDVLVDEGAVNAFFGTTNAKDGKKQLSNYINDRNFDTDIIGVNVHVKMPLGEDYHQLDIMVVANAKQVADYHKHVIPEGSPYKGVHKQLALSKIAKEQGMLWSAWKGLYERNDKGKAGNLISYDYDTIVKKILGDNCTTKDAACLESILATMSSNNAEVLMNDLVKDDKWDIPESAELTRIKELAGLNLNSVKMICY